ncbi:MAG: hypothetical protein P8010_23030 [Desulfosarcinaceae bacterium]
METFAAAKPLVDNPQFASQRRRCLEDLDESRIDAPIRPLIQRLNRLPYCFTLQCCWGHFTFAGRDDIHNLQLLPTAPIPTSITYRLAYLALCIDATAGGRALLETLAQVPRLDPANIQFGSPEWFWRQQVNSYALQVEPERFKDQDQAHLDPAEALRIEALRNRFFERLAKSV